MFIFGFGGVGILPIDGLNRYSLARDRTCFRSRIHKNSLDFNGAERGTSNDQYL